MSIRLSGKICLDTSAVVEILRHPETYARLVDCDDVALGAIALGELYFGARRSIRPEETLRAVAAFQAGVRVLPVTARTAEVFGRLRAALAEKGRPIPMNDVWVAASAMEHDLPLLSQDTHFDAVPGLVHRHWEPFQPDQAQGS